MLLLCMALLHEFSDVVCGDFGKAALQVVDALALPVAAFAQQLSLDVGEGGSATARMIQIIALITLLSVAPSLLMMAVFIPICWPRVFKSGPPELP